ncbi:MAG TPA: hypothetical protein PKA00_09615 [Saprospiraceae bacterium]|nr:hypothetical protein [Saprospiraceae bacterium]HMQ83156.1 hypothetical protein [Saprospiraceae bacterium]
MRLTISLLLALAITGGFAQTDDKYFDGIHIGANVGSQNLFGGSFVDGVDVLAQEFRFVAELFTGFRKQFLKGRMMAGAEVQIGFTDGNLIHQNPAESLTINYKNNFQSGYGLTLGAVFLKKKTLLAYAYAFETERKFDVSIRDAFGTYQQKDEQGMLKYGLGLEAKIWRGLHARATLGRLRVDFGDQITNIEVDDKWDFTAGVVWQFRLKINQ